jgi:hypothetical protein
VPSFHPTSSFIWRSCCTIIARSPTKCSNNPLISCYCLVVLVCTCQCIVCSTQKRRKIDHLTFNLKKTKTKKLLFKFLLKRYLITNFWWCSWLSQASSIAVTAAIWANHRRRGVRCCVTVFEKIVMALSCLAAGGSNPLQQTSSRTSCPGENHFDQNIFIHSFILILTTLQSRINSQSRVWII